MPRWNCLGTSGWSTYEDEVRSAWLAGSSEVRDDRDVAFSFSFLGEAGLLGIVELFHWAACDGRVTVAVTVLAFWACRATLNRFGLLELCASWLVVEVNV
jgi:hypothetical protein